NDTANSVKLLTRSASSVSFTAPAGADQTLEFTLTVADSDGASDDATVTVNVVDARDPNAFLEFGGADYYTVVAVPSVPVNLGQETPFSISIERRLTYTDLAGITHESFALDPEPLTLTGAWLPGATSDACNDAGSPRFTLPVPQLDADDVLAMLAPTVEDQARALDPSKIDEARLTLRINISALMPVGSSAAVCVLDADSARVSPEQGAPDSFDAGRLAGAASRSRDTRASAEAYYQAIDPSFSKDRFSKWLAIAGFTDGGTDWGSIEQGSSAHAVYLNNYDLGFGRDMFMRVGECDGAEPDLGGTIDPELIGTCDAYAVVINYASLEGAAKKTGAVLAVAMEYTRLPGTTTDSPRVTQFYTFAPDRQGDFVRVLSANLDGRGEKYLPQACVVCHGGNPGGLLPNGSYSAGGDVNAGFMPWDLDSFLYSDTDTAFSNSGDPYFPTFEQELAAKYTRGAQEQEFKKLNGIAYLTLGSAASTRFRLARQLMEGWYGGPGMPNASFSGDYVPPEWADGYQWPDGSGRSNPPGSANIYRKVFAPNCRACHTLQASGGGVSTVVMGSYKDFVTTGSLNDQLERGLMPFARLTMDRFWLPEETSAADILSAHFQDDDDPDTLPFDRPGPIANISDGLAEGELLQRGDALPLSGAGIDPGSTNFAWHLEKPLGSNAELIFASTSNPTLVGVDLKGIYSVSLNVANAETVTCDEALVKDPDASACVRWTRADTTPVVQSIDGAAVPASFQLTKDTPRNLAIALVPSSPGDGQVSLAQITIGASAFSAGVTAADCSTEGGGLCVRVTAAESVVAPVTLDVVVADEDGDQSGASFTVIVPATLSAPGCSLAIQNLPIGVASSPQVIDLNTSGCVVGAPEGTVVNFRLGSVLSGGGSLNATPPSGLWQYTPPAGKMTTYYRPLIGVATISDDYALVGFEAFIVGSNPESKVVGSAAILFEGTQDNDFTDDTKQGDAVGFTGLRNAMAGACQSCHATQNPPNTTYPNLTSIHWLGNSAKDGFKRMRCWTDVAQTSSSPEWSESGDLYVNFSVVSDSALLKKPQGDSTYHGGGNQNIAQDLKNRLQQWIEQGAYFTEGEPTDQGCTSGVPAH
ncbi:MAG TPA: hypothetical protein VFI92_12535, partial [Steroidobacteraceae bacterium]|nr:hypothetical protein [Steroidobacteraceae bacterium]